MAIQVRRGHRKDFDPTKMLPGEWAVSIDAGTSNQIVWMCFAPGVTKRMGTWEDLEAELDPYKEACQSYSDSAKDSSDKASVSESNAKKSEDNAKVSETNAKASEDKAKEYKDSAFSGTPEGYEQVANNSYIHNANSTSFSLTTSKGGIRLNKVEGKTHKSKNLLKPTLQTTTQNGVTCTANGDGTYTLNGTSTSGVSFSFANAKLSAGAYKLIGCKNGSYSTYTLRAYDSVSGMLKIDVGSGVTFEIDKETRFNVFVDIATNTVFNNVVFKPMITTDTSLTYDDYEPYGIFSSGEMGLVDLGSLEWIKDEGVNVFRTLTSNWKAPIKFFTEKLYCTKYHYSDKLSITNPIDKTIRHTGTEAYPFLRICDNDYTDATVFKQSLQGVMLAYELAEGATPDKYALVVEEVGKNLFNGAIESGSISGSGVNIANTSRIRVVDYIAVKPNTTYTVSFSGFVDSLGISFYGKGMQLIKDVSWIDSTSYKFVTTDSTEYIRLYFRNKTQNTSATLKITDIERLQVEEGEATPYTPYAHKTVFFPLTEPLRSVGDVKDTIENGKIVRRVGCVDLGSLKIIVQSSSEHIFSIDKSTLNANSPIKTGFCGKYPVCNNSSFANTKEGTINLGHTAGIFIKDSNYSDLSSFKQSLQGVLLAYELATPTIEDYNETAPYELESFNDKTYIDTADVYAKATLDVDYGMGDVSATALNGERLANKNRVLLEQNIASLQAMVLELETES